MQGLLGQRLFCGSVNSSLNTRGFPTIVSSAPLGLSNQPSRSITTGMGRVLGSFGPHKSPLRKLNRLNVITSSNEVHSSFSRKMRLFSSSVEQMRNIAIIAHVDHGKTTMVDALLRQSGTLDDTTSERVMDSNTLERERGITILSKITSMKWKDFKINLVDTPGHGDFGGEVERIMNMVDGVILVVDASEGPMAQTKFVLTKALKAGLKPLVVINKMDRKGAVRPDEVEGEVFDLFSALEATEDQMNYPTLYASGRSGWAVHNRKDTPEDMTPLFEAIITHVPPPKVNPNTTLFSMLVSTLENDQFLGRILTGRVHSGSVKVGKILQALDLSGKVIEEGKVLKIMARKGLEKVVLDEALAGDIVGLAGFSKASVAATIADPELKQVIPTTPLDPPVISIYVMCNTSPIAGKEGKQSTFPAIKRRLEKEVETNISLTLRTGEATGEMLELCGRGELQLGIVVENMRREGFEFAISPPQVVFKEEDGRKLEPLEEVIIDVDENYGGTIIERMTQRKGELQDIRQIQGKSRLSFLCPSRALVGFRNELLTQTKGTAIYNHLFHSYVPYKGKLGSFKKGALISCADGVASSFALAALEPRGILFISPQAKVYEGMVIGEHTRDNDLDVNPAKTKQLTNMRAAKADENIRLSPPRLMSLEEYMAYVRSDQLLEITPSNIRLRMAKLNPSQRKPRSDV